MTTLSIDNKQTEKIVSQQSETFSNTIENGKPELSQKGSGLHQVFNKDTLESLNTEDLLPAELTESSIPLWKKIFSWWKVPKNATSETSTSPYVDSISSPSLPPISSIPELEPPENIPTDLQTKKLSNISKKYQTNSTLSSDEIFDSLTHMNERSIESVMFIIFKAQAELEKENANVGEKTFSKYLEFQKLQQKVLFEIKDVLAKDEKVANHLKTAQNITSVAGFISGIAMAAVSFGLLAPVGKFIGAKIGSGVASAFMGIATAIGNVGPAISGGLTALTLGSKTYFKNREKEDRAKHVEYEHHDRYFTTRLDDSRERLMHISETDTAFKERWILFLKRCDRMRRLVLNFKK